MGRIIAMAGKGGTGKTTITALIVRLIKEKKLGSVLAIDADPNSNLGELLGAKSGESIGKILDLICSDPDKIPTGMTKERFIQHQVQSAITDWLTHKRYLWWRNNSGGSIYMHKGKSRFVRFGKKGSPDVFVLIQGHLFGIEVKSDKGFQSQVQKEFEVEFTRAGGRYILAFKLEDVITGIEVLHG